MVHLQLSHQLKGRWSDHGDERNHHTHLKKVGKTPTVLTLLGVKQANQLATAQVNKSWWNQLRFQVSLEVHNNHRGRIRNTAAKPKLAQADTDPEVLALTTKVYARSSSYTCCNPHNHNSANRSCFIQTIPFFSNGDLERHHWRHHELIQSC